MSAGTALAARLVEALEGLGLSGVYDGPPARAAFPYAAIDCGNERDWGHKSGEGREIMAAVTLWDDMPGRLVGLAEAAEAAIAGTAAVAGWDVASLRLERRRTLRDVAGPWAVMIESRVRMLRQQGGQ